MNPQGQPPAAPATGGPWWGLLTHWPEPALVAVDGLICLSNAPAQDLLGLPQDLLLGQCWLQVLGRGSTELQQLNLARPVRPGQPWPRPQPEAFELQWPRPDGPKLRLSCIGMQVENEPQPVLVLVLRDVTSERLAQADLERSRDDLRRLAIGLTTVQEQERQRIAVELHDELQQTLAAMRMQLEAVREGLPPPAAELARRLGEVNDMALTALDATRRIVNDLRPMMLDELGLEPALEALVLQFRRRTGLDVTFDVTQVGDMAPAPVPPDLATALYRTAQEALNNVARHARASKVQVQLSFAPGRGVSLAISDNGAGMPLDERRRPFSVGLLTMQERLRACGAVLRLDSATGGGTTVCAVAPAPGQHAPAVPAPAPAPAAPDELGALMRFLYATPVGLVQATLDGHIDLINPVAAQLLMPFSRDGRLENLFTVLDSVAPHLRRLAAGLAAGDDAVCEGEVLQLAGATGHAAGHRVMLSMLRQPGARLMCVLGRAPSVSGQNSGAL
jgi:signal transduction histidine kinase